MADPGARSIWLIADDYGFSPGVSETIRTLLETGRLSGTGCMTLFDDWRIMRAPWRRRMAGS